MDGRGGGCRVSDLGFCYGLAGLVCGLCTSGRRRGCHGPDAGLISDAADSSAGEHDLFDFVRHAGADSSAAFDLWRGRPAGSIVNLRRTWRAAHRPDGLIPGTGDEGRTA